MTTSADPTYTFSCVTDEFPHLQLQTHYWAISLLHCAGVPPNRLLVHAVGRLDPSLAAWLAEHGIAVVHIRPFRGPGYCNKLNALRSLSKVKTSHVVAMDCDTVVASAASWPAPEHLAAKMVDAARPPASRWQAILQVTGLGSPDWAPADLKDGPEGRLTEAGNRNGGVYVWARSVPAEVESEWRRWLTWCMAPPPEVGHLHWVDQVSLALARRTLGLRFDLLERRFNFPLVEDPELLRQVAPEEGPVVLHHHHHLDEDHLLIEPGIDVIDQTVEAVNQALRAHRSARLVERLGPAARQGVAPHRRLLRALERRLPQRSV